MYVTYFITFFAHSVLSNQVVRVSSVGGLVLYTGDHDHGWSLVANNLKPIIKYV